MKTDCMLVKEGEGGGAPLFCVIRFVASFHLLYYLIYSRL